MGDLFGSFAQRMRKKNLHYYSQVQPAAMEPSGGETEREGGSSIVQLDLNFANMK